MQFLQLVESIASNLTTGNVSEFITLTENLIQLAESMIPHTQTNSPSASTSMNNAAPRGS